MTNYLVFKRGREHLEYSKEIAEYEGNAFLPQRVFIPLSYNENYLANPLVSPGEPVKEGQLLIRSNKSNSVSVHSSVPGILYNFVKFDLPDGKVLHTAAVKLEGSFDILGKRLPNYSWRESPPQELIRIIDDAGVLNTALPSASSLSYDLRKAVKANKSTLCVNFFDNDPSCGLNSVLLSSELDKILEGACMLAKILDAKKIICIHKMKRDGLKKLERISELWPNAEISFVKASNAYPSMIRFSKKQREDMLFVDIPSLIYAYEAVKTDQPLTSIFVLIGGDALNETKVLKVRIGTPLGCLVEECGGFKIQPEHIILNGLIRGISVSNLDMPVTKKIKSIHFLGKERIKPHSISACINCGLCFNSCPHFLDPKKILRHIERGEITDEILDAIEICKGCSCCSAVCPARIPLASIIADAKTKYQRKASK